jgi:hypothetical protein
MAAAVLCYHARACDAQHLDMVLLRIKRTAADAWPKRVAHPYMYKTRAYVWLAQVSDRLHAIRVPTVPCVGMHDIRTLCKRADSRHGGSGCGSRAYVRA